MLEYLQGRIFCQCLCRLGKGRVGVSSWKFSRWLLQMIFWKFPMFQQGCHSCGPEWTWGFHASSSSSFLHYHAKFWASILYYYCLVGHAQSHLYLGWKTGYFSAMYSQCPIIKIAVMVIIKYPLIIQGRRATHGGKMGHGFMPTITIYIYWRWIMDYPITGYVVMDILSIVGALVHHHRGGETMSTTAGEYERCAAEWWSLTSMGPPHPVTCE